MNILFTCAGRRNYLLSYFREAAGDGCKIVGADMDKTSPALQVCDKAYLVPSVYDEHYIDAVLAICKEESIDILLSLNDLELPIIAKNRDRFNAIGVTAIVSDADFIDTCFDKLACHDWLIKEGFQTPLTYFKLESALVAINKKELTFPIIVKPRWGSASMSVYKVNSVEELELVYQLVQLQLKSGMLSDVSAEDEHNVLIQQMLVGTEFGLDILNDLNAKTHQVVVKEKIAMRSGETDKSCVRSIPVLQQLGWGLGQRSGHIGNIDCDVFFVNGVPYIIEINPRFGGGYPFSHAAGANYPLALIRWVAGNAFVPDEAVIEYDQVYAKAENIIAVNPSMADSLFGLCVVES